MDIDSSARALCLDFVNTWGDRGNPTADTLRSYLDLLEWAHRSRSIDGSLHRRMAEAAAHRPQAARRAFAAARELRETIFRLCAAVADGRQASIGDIDGLNAWLDAVPKARLCRGEECCTWVRPAGGPDLRQVVWPVALSAANLLTSTDAQRLRQCAAPDCSWLFLDRSRGRRRRWCDMSTCGNRAKARRHYERHHQNT